VAIRQAYFDLNGTLFDPAAMAEPLGGEAADDLVDEILGEAVLMAMTETLSGSYSEGRCPHQQLDEKRGVPRVPLGP
jgi:hypothetical protein